MKAHVIALDSKNSQSLGSQWKSGVSLRTPKAPCQSQECPGKANGIWGQPLDPKSALINPRNAQGMPTESCVILRTPKAISIYINPRRVSYGACRVSYGFCRGSYDNFLLPIRCRRLAVEEGCVPSFEAPWTPNSSKAYLIYGKTSSALKCYHVICG